MRRQILHLLGESPRRNPRPALALAEAVVGDNQRLMAMRPSEWGERAGDSQQIEYGSFHRPPAMNERTGTVPAAASAPFSRSPDDCDNASAPGEGEDICHILPGVAAND